MNTLLTSLKETYSRLRIANGNYRGTVLATPDTMEDWVYEQYLNSHVSLLDEIYRAVEVKNL